MAKIERFEDIESWRLAREVTNLIYDASSVEPFAKDFALCNQIRRASISILSNIAEGFEREGNKEFLHFLAIAKGSCGEVRAQLYIAHDRSYLDDKAFEIISMKLLETSRLLAGFMRYLRQTELQGSKFRSGKP